MMILAEIGTSVAVNQTDRFLQSFILIAVNNGCLRPHVLELHGAEWCLCDGFCVMAGLGKKKKNKIKNGDTAGDQTST